MPVNEHPAALVGGPIAWDSLGRLLVVRPDNLGDVVMAGPAIRALHTAAPQAELHVLAAPAGAAVARLLPGVHDVLTVSASWQHAGRDEVPPAQDDELVDLVRDRGYDAAVILTSFSQSPWPAGYLLRKAGVPIRVGLSKEFGGVGLTHWVPSPADDLHQVDRSLYLLQRVGVAALDRRLHVEVPAEAVVKSAQVLAEHGIEPGTPYALVLPGASCSSRRYPAARFAEVAARLARQGLVPAVVGTAKEAPLVEEVAGLAAGAVAVAGALDVPALAAALSASSVVVCNNSGGMHLASALGAPLVALFAGTEQLEQYEPRFSPATVLTVGVACSPCRQFTCPYSLECLDIAPQEAAAAALALARA